MKRLLLASGFAVLPVAAYPADLGPTEYTWIEDNAPAGHQATVTFSLAATYFDMDVTNGFSAAVVSAAAPRPVLRNPDNGFGFDTWGISGDVEAWMPTAGSGYLIGGVEGAWVEDNMASTVVYPDTETLVALRFGDTKLSVTVGGSLNTAEFSASSEFYRVAGLAGWGTQLANGVKVGVGAYVAYSELALDATYQNAGVTERFSRLDETVTTWSGGVALLGETRREIVPGVGVFLKGRVAALYANGGFDGSQEIGPYFQSADDSAEAFAGLAEGQLGFDFALGPNARVSIFGGAAWRNDVFEIVNPSAAPGDLLDVVYGFPRLEQTDLIEYSAGGKVEFTF